jgi:hypothetical protein
MELISRASFSMFLNHIPSRYGAQAQKMHKTHTSSADRGSKFEIQA